MSTNEKQCLDLLRSKVKQEDEVYEVIRRKKTTLKSILLDILIDPIISGVSNIKESMIKIYLVASEQEGNLYVFEKGKDVSIISIQGWEKKDKESFKSVVIQGYVYKKYRKVTL